MFVEKSSKHQNGTNNGVEPIIKYSIDNFFKITVKKDFESLQKNVKLATTPKVEKLHLLHSVYGHASAGHGEFHEHIIGKKVPIQYKNITLDDIIKQIPKEDSSKIKRGRQELIDQIIDWVYERIETLKDPGRKALPEDFKLVKVYREKNIPTKIEPLAGALMFEHAILKNFESVLMGFYLGSCMDGYEWREKVDKKYGINMHKGTSIPVDVHALKRYGLILDDFQYSEYRKKLPQLAHLSHNDTIKELTYMGIIPKKFNINNGNDYQPAFLELSKGNGISDDAAFITASLVFGIEAGFGLLLADAIDTLDKYVPTIEINGQDELAGKMMKKKYESRLGKEFPVSDDQVLELIYLSAISSENYDSFPSCSQRRFWQMDENKMTAVQSHMSFLNFIKDDSRYPASAKIGFKQVMNNKFYSSYKKRLEDAKTKGINIDKYVSIRKNGF
jgi:hypothetical protein